MSATPYIRQYHGAERLTREEAFGREQLEADLGHMATDAVTEMFVNIISGLCAGPQGTGTPGVFEYRFLPRAQGPQRPRLSITTNPQGLPGLGLSRAEQGVAAVQNVYTRRGLMKPAHLAPGFYAVSDSVFVDHRDGLAKVERTILPRVVLGQPVELSAIKGATEEEVAGAMDVIWAAVTLEEHQAGADALPVPTAGP